MKKIFIHLALMIVAAIAIGWLAMLWLDSWTRHGETISVPAVRSLAYDRAVDMLTAEGLKGIVADSVYDNRTQPGTVIEQNPKAGTIVKEGREVYLTINAFSPKMVTLPLAIRYISASGPLDTRGSGDTQHRGTTCAKRLQGSRIECALQRLASASGSPCACKCHDRA